MNLSFIAEKCQYLLNNSPEGEETLTYISNRLTQESQNNFLFGYFPPAEKIDLLLNLIGEEPLLENKLIYTREISSNASARNNIFSYFENYPMIVPYRDVYGNIIALMGRSILSDTERKEKKISKYKNTSFNRGNHLFGLFESKQEILSSGFAYVVEGQFDVIKAHEKGLKNIVGLGSSNMTGYQASLLARYTDTLFLLLDNDEAGEAGRKKIIEKYGKFININNLYLPEGYKDIDEYLSQNSLESMTLLC